VPDCYADLGFKTISTNPCGEIPLCTYDSCRLLAINLYSYVDKPFTPDASFDSDLFIDHVHKAQRMMDDIIDLELEKIDNILKKINSDPEDEAIKARERNLWLNIKEKAIQGRRPVSGSQPKEICWPRWGHVTDRMTPSIFPWRFIKCWPSKPTVHRSHLLLKRGAFPIWKAEREKDNPFILRLKEAAPELYEDMVKHGRRNIAILTIAPTGSVSILSQTTSGLEPVFAVTYKRRRKVNPNDKHARITFTDEIGDTWEEYHVFHHKFVTWLESKGYNLDEVSHMDEKELRPSSNNHLITKQYPATSIG